MTFDTGPFAETANGGGAGVVSKILEQACVATRIDRERPAIAGLSVVQVCARSRFWVRRQRYGLAISQPPPSPMTDVPPTLPTVHQTIAHSRAMIDQSRALIDQSRDLIAVSPVRQRYRPADEPERPQRRFAWPLFDA